MAIDITSLQRQHVGVDSYLKHLVLELGRVDRESRYFLFANLEDRSLLRRGLPPNFSIVPVSIRARATRLAFQQAWLPAVAGVLRLDVIHSPSQLMPLSTGKARHLLTIHDLTQLSIPECHTRLRRSWMFRRAIQASIRRADAIVVPTRHVRSHVLEVGEIPAHRVHVIPEGVGREFSPRAGNGAEPRLSALGVTAPYLLFVGTLEPRKNLELLLEAFTELVERGQIGEHLVVAGKRGWGVRGVLRSAARARLRERVRILGFVDQELLPALYANARAFVYPSREEGFGLPPLEAMASGIPTIATETSALSENLRGAAELVQPGDRAGLATAIRRVLSDHEHRVRLRELGLERAAGFRWESTAHATLERYRALAELGPRRGREGASRRRPGEAKPGRSH